MIRAFISQPMKDKTNEEIESERKRVIEKIKEYSADEVIIIDSFFKDAPHNAKPLWYLAKSIEMLSTANLAYFVKGWNDCRGCKIEYQCAKEYGIHIIAE